MRSRILIIPVLLAFAALPAAAPAQTLTDTASPTLRIAAAVTAPTLERLVIHAPAAAGIDSLSRPVSAPAVRAALALPGSQPSGPHTPLSFDLSVLGAALATKRSTRRSTGKKRDVPMFLDSDVHVMREGRDGHPEHTAIAGGVLVDDTDLTDDEIDELTARRVIRPATPEEIDRLERRDADDARTELLRRHETELAQLRANQEAERASLDATGPAPDAVARMSDKHATATARLQAQQAAALAKLDA